MKSPKKLHPKENILRQSGTLNPRPERVNHPLFREKHFFDPRDLLQVKYEMLRYVQNDKKSISQAAQFFGFSRPSFYEARNAFKKAGIAGLLPAKKGPRRAHKLSEEIMAFVLQMMTHNPSLDAEALVPILEKEFQLSVHSRSIERALARTKKKQH